ncbi:MAG: glycosyltransferase [Armatimonadota bacterium]|nr:glycosyltransferase [Armatimonadota bacterium]
MKEYPPIVMEHLRTLTDHTGVIQHAIYSIPNRHTGYCTDDNARALIVAVKEYERTADRSLLQLVSTYISFLHYAQTPSKRFHNFMSFDQIFLDDVGSEDAFGRTLLACGTVLEADVHENLKKVARQLFNDSLRWLPTMSSLRGRAFVLLGCRGYLQGEPDADHIRQHVDSLARGIVDEFCDEKDWRWFEKCLTYSNGALPSALIAAYQIIDRREYLDTALKALDFLRETTIIDGILQLVGCNGWYIRGNDRALWDQQPLDANSMVNACLAAYQVTQDKSWLECAKTSFDWFFGANILKEPMYDPVTGGCYDGLTPEGPNLNQGAESTISCLIAQLAVYPYIDQFQQM